jgi:hypothetical protein
MIFGLFKPKQTQNPLTAQEIASLRASLESTLEASNSTTDNRAFSICNAIFKLQQLCLDQRQGMTIEAAGKTIQINYCDKSHTVKSIYRIG